jgi:Domain of unknown function (DUF4129)
VIASGPIGREAARRLARDELSKAIYHPAPSLPARIAHDIAALLDRLFSGASAVTPGGWWTVVGLAALAVAAGSVIAVRLGPLARSARAPGPAWDAESRAMTARELRDASAASAASGDYSAAILQRLRAIVAACEERGLLAAEAGRTANEVAAQVGARFPGHRADLAAAAQSFDDVRYGGGTGTRDGYERLCALDATLATLRPAPEPAYATAVTRSVAAGTPA